MSIQAVFPASIPRVGRWASHVTSSPITDESSRLDGERRPLPCPTRDFRVRVSPKVDGCFASVTRRGRS